MDIFSAFILGLIEGITEFLPISSTGHLILASHFLRLESVESNVAFNIIIQGAAVLAVLIVYRTKIKITNISLFLKLLIAFLPIAIVGLLLSNILESLFSIFLVAWMFIIGGLIFLAVEFWYHKKVKLKADYFCSNLDTISYKQALIIGLIQATAIIPGTSRAGASIIGGMLSQVDRTTSTEFSFLLAIPVIGAAAGYTLLKSLGDLNQSISQVNLADIYPLIFGFIVAFLVSILALKVLIAFLSKYSFIGFGIYRIIFGLFLLSIF